MNGNRFENPMMNSANTTDEDEPIEPVSQELMEEYILKHPQKINVGVAS